MPKGLILPMAHGVDEARWLLSKENIYCDFHQNKSKSPKKRSSYLKMNHVFKTVEKMIIKFFRFIFFNIFYFIDMVLPRFILNIFRSFFNKIKNLRKTVSRFGLFLKTYRDKILWFAVIPALILWGCIATLGVGIVSSIYLFYVTSHWSGKMLSQLSNLLVLGKKAPEWIFLKNAAKVIKGRISLQRFYRKYRDSFLDNAKLFFLHIVPVIFFGGLNKFFAWVFCEFISWLAIYTVLKRAAEQAPTRLYKFERYLKCKENASPKSKKCRLSNACWLISYEAFARTASNEAQHTFRKLHQKSHSRHSLKLSSRIK